MAAFLLFISVMHSSEKKGVNATSSEILSLMAEEAASLRDVVAMLRTVKGSPATMLARLTLAGMDGIPIAPTRLVESSRSTQRRSKERVPWA